MSVMQSNRTKQLLEAGGTALGCVIQQLASPEVPAILAAAGFDYVFIDLEHGCIDLQTVQALIRSSMHHGITPLVRVGELLYSLVARVLDAGAQGIILPRVEDPHLLERAVLWTKYPPIGTRGFGITPVQLNYEAHSFPEIISHLNAQTSVIVQIESEGAVARAADLISVGGVDVAMIGPADLSIALGVPGEMEHPKLLRAIEHCIDVCLQGGVVPGIQVRDLGSASRWIERGMRFVGCGTEHIFLLDRALEVGRTLRRAVSERLAPA
jgi:2-keto-3-deoxy-L-rhamnonate aldolase RhmA